MSARKSTHRTRSMPSRTKLIIKFRCLCFFVRDEVNQHMHVLMPATCGCAGGAGIDQHEVVLVFRQKGGRLNSSGNFLKPGQEGRHDFRRMEDWSLVLGEDGGKADLTLPPSVVDLGTVTGGTIASGMVLGPRDPRISSRITLKGGSANPKTMDPGFWDFAGLEHIPLAQDVTWTMDIPAGPLTLNRVPFTVGGHTKPEVEGPIPVLHPNDRGEIKLEVHHVMLGDFGRPLKVRDPDVTAQHFGAFYTLYDNPASRPLPKFNESNDTGVVGCIPTGGTMSSLEG